MASKELTEIQNTFKLLVENLYAAKKIKEVYSDDRTSQGFFAFIYTIKQWLYNVMYGTLTENKDQAEYEEYIRYLSNYITNTLLPLCMARIKVYSKHADKVEIRAILSKWLELEDDLFAMSAYRNLKSFALYIERGNSKKIWRDTIHIFENFFDYAQQIVFGKDISLLRACYFPGAGKTYALNLLCAFWFGCDETVSILRITYSDDLAKTFIQQIGDIIDSKQFRKVFPKFDLGKGVGNTDLYSTFNISVGFQFKFSKFKNFYASTRDGQSTGKRAKVLMLDDLIKDDTEAYDDYLHEKITKRYDSVWTSRADDSKQKVIIGGTMWASKDLLNVLYLRERKRSNMLNDVRYKYTQLAYRIDTRALNAVFISTPILDEELNKPTCPLRYDMKYINEKREDMDEALFQAEYQQNPIPPEEFLFSPNRLETYNWDTLPEQIKSDINTECWAFIDPTRRGNDFFAMGILKRYKVKDYTSKWYLVDCIFEQKPSKDLIPKVFIKTRQHKISKIGFENNIDVSYGELLRKTMDDMARGLNDFYMPLIEPKFSFGSSKEAKIRNASSGMISKIVYPELNLFSPSSELGAAMIQLSSWRLELRYGEHDDFPDMLSMFVKYYCEEKPQNTMQVLSRNLVSFT